MKKTIFSCFIFLSSFIGLPLTDVVHADQCAFNEYNECNSLCENSCKGTFSIGGDWLYWKTREARLDYASAVTFTGDDATVNISAKVLKPKFKYDNGYRVFADYTTCDQLWKISAIFSHIPSHARNDFSEEGGVGMMGMTFISLFNANFPILNAIAGAEFNSINSKWDSSISYFDLNLSRNFAVCDCIELIPHLGIRGLWMDQTLHLQGSGDTLFFSSKLKGRFSSYGLEGGIMGVWRIYDGLYLIGNLGGSLLYSNSHKSGDLHAEGEEELQPAINISFTDHDQKGLPTYDAYLGLKYARCFSNFMFDIHLGWERHVIFSTNDFSLAGSDNTTLQGLTLGGSICF